MQAMAARFPAQPLAARLGQNIGRIIGVALVVLFVAYAAADVFNFTASIDALALAGGK